MRAALGPVAADAVRPPVGRDARARRHRHQRQDDHHLPARGDRGTTAAGRPRRCRRHGRRARRRREPIADSITGAHTTPGGQRPAGAARAHARRRRDTVAMEVSSHALRPAPRRRRAVRGRVLHQPEPRAPRLPRYARRVLRGQGVAVHARAHAGRPRSTSTTRAASSSRRVPRATASTCGRYSVDDAARRSRRDRRGVRRRCDARHDRRSAQRVPMRWSSSRSSARSTSPTRWPPPPPPGPPGRPFDAVVVGSRRPAGRPRPHGAGRRRPALRGARRLRPHARRPRAGAGRRPTAGRGRRARSCACSAAAATATRGSARSWARRSRPAPTSPSLTSDNPRSEDPQAIADAVLPGPRRRARRAGRARPAAADRRRAGRRPRPGDVVVLAGKGHETGQTTQRAHGAVRRPRRRA